MASEVVRAARVGAEPIVEAFEDCGLDEGLLRGIYSYGLEKPREIQQRGLKPMLDGRDLVAQAQLGAGKTTALVIGCLQRIDFRQKVCQALIVAPTREIVNQIQSAVLALGTYQNVTSHVCVAGTPVRRDIDTLREGQHLVVGTPRPVFDMIRKGHLRVEHLKACFLDDVDDMLSRGFKERTCDMLQTLPPSVQVCLFSATMASDILDLTTKIRRDAVRICVEEEELTLEGVQHFHVPVEKGEWKLDTLLDLFETLTITQAVIYRDTRSKVDFLADKLAMGNFTVATMHADLGPSDRDLVMSKFRSGVARVLICTDVAHGFDMQQVPLVINYDLPRDSANYLHRVGRRGGFGRNSVAISFVTDSDSDAQTIEDIEELYQIQIEALPLEISELI